MKESINLTIFSPSVKSIARINEETVSKNN